MPIRFLKVSSYYPRYLGWFYERNPQLRSASYATQHAALMRDGFSWSDAWQKQLEGTGQFVVGELVFNAEFLQKQWARENGVNFTDEGWPWQIFLAQVAKFQPRILFAHTPEVAFGPLAELKSRAGPLAVIVTDGVAMHDARFARSADLMLTCVKRSVAYYAGLGLRSIYMPHGFNAAVLPDLPVATSRSELSFIGGVDVGTGHQNRVATLGTVAAQLPLDLWLSNIASNRKLLRLFASFIRRGRWNSALHFPQTFSSLATLRGKNRGELFGLAMFAQLAASRVTLNVHIDVAGEQAGNIRLYEATGVGACLLTDWKPNIGELFEPDREVVVFRSPEEAVEKSRYLLENEPVRKEIAARGQKRTLASHDLQRQIQGVTEAILRLIT